MRTAAIESLPIELLQPIFAASGYNIALVQASANLGVRLSSEYVYHNTCDYYLRDQCDDFAARSAAQKVMFASKWMTWPFFKSWLVKAYESKGCLCGLTPEEGCFDAQWPPAFENAISMVFSRSHLPRLAFIRCRLPKKLLGGPWTANKVQFLRFLLWTTSMTVDWKDSETHVLVLDGRQRAFLEGNLEAVELFNNNRRLGRPPTLETVRFAVADASCNRSIVYDTLKSAYRWNPSRGAWDYSALHQWCDQRIWDNDIRGVWLRGMLQSLRHSEFGFHDKSMDRDASFSKIVDAAAEAYSDEFCDEFIRNELPWHKVSHDFIYIPYSPHAPGHIAVNRYPILCPTRRGSGILTGHDAGEDAELLKVIATRGWLIVGSLLPTHHRVAHQIHWTQVMQQAGPRMYSGPSCPRRLSCCSGDGRDIQQGLAWLNVPTSR
jgi:hypothetical protein